MPDFLFIGVDIAANTFDACVMHGNKHRFKEWNNIPEGHQAFIHELQRRKTPSRVVLEATGVYHLELAWALHNADGIEVCVINPRLFKSFAKALNQRGKTDQKDAHVLAVYAQRMRFEPWSPPSDLLMAVRSITRRITQLAGDRTRKSNRLHALEHSVGVSSLVIDQLRCHLSEMEADIEELEAEAVRLIQASDTSQGSDELGLLQSIPGVGQRTALVLWSELTSLPPGMTVRQWVAHCGLDVCDFQSGSSVRGRERISKRGNKFVRRVLFMSALSAPKGCEAVSRYRQELLDRGKKPKVAAVAVMRKLLHCVYGILKTGMPYDPNKFRAPVAAA